MIKQKPEAVVMEHKTYLCDLIDVCKICKWFEDVASDLFFRSELGLRVTN